MIVPGIPSDPIQIIDVRDLADFIIHCLQGRIFGSYNVTGPARELSMKAMVEGLRQGIGSDANFTWISNDYLNSAKVPDGKFPLYVPPEGESAGLHRVSISRALAGGLKFRPISDTGKATLDWYKSLPADLQPRIAPQFATVANQESWLEMEKRVLQSWRSSQKK